MFITPMIPVRSAAELSAPNQTEQTREPAGGMFADIFQQAINNVKETEEDEVSRETIPANRSA